MEAIQTDAGMASLAQGLFGKAQGQTGKGGGLFAALLALVGRPAGNSKETGQNGDGGVDAAAGLQGLLALFNPAPIGSSTDQPLIGDSGSDSLTAIGDSGADPLTALATANGLDLSQIGDRNKLALLAQALADMKNGDVPAASTDTTNAGIAPDPAATGQTLSAADLDAILAELRARAAAKFGADNGKPAVTRDAPAAVPTAADGTASKPLTPGLEIALPAKAAPFGLDGSRGDRAAPALDNSEPAAVPATTPVQPAVAGASLVSIEPDSDGETTTEASGSIESAEAVQPATDSEAAAPAVPADGKAPPSKTPDAGTSPFQKVEVAPPPSAKSNAKSGTHEPVRAAATPDAERKVEPKPASAPTADSDDARADKATPDDSSQAAAGSDAADAGSSNSSSAANAVSVDARSHAAARGPIQLPVEKLSQFLTQDDQLPLQIQRAVANGRDHITIQIVPHDLGRIEIKLDFDRSGTLSTVIAADRPQTLDLLKRDATGLERALQDAGFKTDGSSLSFNLQGDQRQQYQSQQNNPGPSAWQSSAAEEAERAYRPTYRIASTADAIRAAADGRLNIAV